MMISHVAFLAGDDAHHLLENAFDEILRPQGQGDHPGLWVQFAKRLGATDAELDEAAAPLAEVAGFPLTMTYYCPRSAEEGLASWYADEEQLPEVHGATALALRKYYGCDDATIEYFVEHVRADLGHSDANEVPAGPVLRYPAAGSPGPGGPRWRRCGPGGRCTRASSASCERRYPAIAAGVSPRRWPRRRATSRSSCRLPGPALHGHRDRAGPAAEPLLSPAAPLVTARSAYMLAAGPVTRP